MKNTMKFLALISINLAVVSSGFGKTPDGWVTGVDDALARAKKDNKHVMVLFTGSDFCPPCMMMQKEVFTKKEFVTKAGKDFILVFVDFPEADEALAKSNEPLMEEYSVPGLPTVLVFDPSAREIGRFAAHEFPEVDAFVEKLALVIERGELD